MSSALLEIDVSESSSGASYLKKNPRDAADEIWITNFSWCSGFSFAESWSPHYFLPTWTWFSSVADSSDRCVSMAAELYF